MPASITGRVQPWFTINEALSDSVTASTNIDVSNISAVAFSVDVEVTIGSLSTAFPLTAGTPLGIDSSTEKIQTDVDAFMFAMGGR
ncbi:MAG: hypothetical protein WCR98_08635 [Saccharofermentanales bacterium]